MNANELADELESCRDYELELFTHKTATMLRQQQLKIDNLLENNARLDTEIEVLKADNDKLTEALLKANRVYDFDNPLLDKELEK